MNGLAALVAQREPGRGHRWWEAGKEPGVLDGSGAVDELLAMEVDDES